MDIKHNMAAFVTVEDGGTVSYFNKQGEFVTERRSGSWASNPSAHLDGKAPEEVTTLINDGDTRHRVVEFGGDDNNDRALNRIREQLEARTLDILDPETGRPKAGRERDAKLLDREINQFNAEVAYHETNSKRLKQGRQGDEAAKLAQAREDFAALESKIDALRISERTNRRGY